MVKPDRALHGRGAGSDGGDRTGRSAGGFSLVEVLVAIIILAVGMLALQAMSMAAVRSGGQADRSSRAVASGTRYLEDGLLELRLGRIPAVFDCTLAGGERVVRTAGTTDDSNLAFVQVQVSPPALGSAALLHTVRTYAYSPEGFDGPSEAFTCP